VFFSYFHGFVYIYKKSQKKKKKKASRHILKKFTKIHQNSAKKNPNTHKKNTKHTKSPKKAPKKPKKKHKKPKNNPKFTLWQPREYRNLARDRQQFPRRNGLVPRCPAISAHSRVIQGSQIRFLENLGFFDLGKCEN
jgi:CRISPR/Cas system CSM-associated protein Csm4 (group 5 of RAMP superfamily)